MSQVYSVRWYFNCKKWIPCKDEFLMAISCVQEEEREKIMKYAYKKDVKSKIIGRLMLRHCVSTMLGVCDDEVSLIRSEKERPQLSSDFVSKYKQTNSIVKSFDFNLSHDGDYCVVAGDWIDKVGIDITSVRIKPVQRYFELMRKTFSEPEWLFIQGEANDQDADKLFRFHRLWALKESLLKAEGSGITTNLRRFIFHCPTKNLTPGRLINDTQVIIDGKEGHKWMFEESLLDNRHIVSVALYGNDDDLNTRRNTHYDQLTLKTIEDLIPKKHSSNIDESYWKIFVDKEEGKV